MKQTIDEFTRAYIECALWSSNDETDERGGEPLDKNYTANDLAPETLAQMVEDCRQFQADHVADITVNLERAGHDFWLTRNNHGAGFWDGDWPEEAGERLTAASHIWGEVNLYVSDGRIYS